MATTNTRKAAETGQIAAEQFRAAFGDVSERAKAAAEKSAKIVEELADLTRGNVEAFVASSKIAAKGVENMSQNAAEYSRKSFEEASAVLKSFAEVKSATDFFRLQGDYARSAFDAAVAESARVSETSAAMLTWIISSSRSSGRSAKAPLVPRPALLTR